MTEPLKPTPDDIDGRLADFTDQMLSASGEEMAGPPNDPALHDLDQTVLRLKKAAGQPADPAMVDRIRSRLAQEWRFQSKAQTASREARAQSSQSQAPRRNWLEGLRRLVPARPLALGYAVVGLLLLALVALLLPGPGQPLSGAAGGKGAWLALAAAGAAILFLLAWLGRSRR